MPRTQEKREAILLAATQVFAERGYHDAKISDIAQRLGFGHGTVYRYFDNKLDLFGQVVARALRTVGRIIQEESPEGIDDIDAFKALLVRLGHRLLTLFTIDETALGTLLFEQAMAVDDSVTDRVWLAYEVFAGFTQGYLDYGVNQGFLRTGLDTHTLAKAINGIVFEAVRHVQHAEKEDREGEMARWLEAAPLLIIDGLRRLDQGV